MEGINKTHQNSITKDIMLKADLILDSISDGISIQDTDYRILYQNKITRDIFGDHRGTFCHRIYERNDTVCESCPLAKVFSDGGIYTSERSVLIGGKSLFVEVKASPLKNPSGKIIAGMVTAREITDRKKAEEALKKMKDELKIRVRDRTQELESMIVLLHNSLYEHKEAEKTIKIHEQQLLTLMSKLAVVEEQERRHIAEHIHDNIGPNLAISKINLEKLQESHPAFTKELQEILELIEQTTKFIRSLTFELSPPLLNELGLNTTVEWLVEKVQERHGIIIEFKSNNNFKELNEEISVLLFRTMRELLNNIIKHSRASKAKISIYGYDDYIEFEVEDDGIGFDVSEIDSFSIKSENFGMLSIRERIKYLNGVFEIKSKPHEGTKVKIVVPVNQ